MIRTLSIFPVFDIYKICIADNHLHIGWFLLMMYSGANTLPFFIIGFIYPSLTPMQGLTHRT